MNLSNILNTLIPFLLVEHSEKNKIGQIRVLNIDELDDSSRAKKGLKRRSVEPPSARLL